ncbi:shTK domain protein, partial [Cooperia oncophora]
MTSCPYYVNFAFVDLLSYSSKEQSALMTVPAVSPSSVRSPGAGGAAGPTATLLATSETARDAYECLDIACLCGFFGGSGGANCVLPNGQRLTRGLRKEYRVLTDAERQRYHTAMRTIITNGDYDVLSRIHSSFQSSPGAHSGPAFLPWHREFLKRRALPYGDSPRTATIPEIFSPAESSLFTNELMGRTGPDGLIQTGAFRGWLTIDQSRVFRRNVGNTGRPFIEADISAVQATNNYQQVLAYTAPSQGCPTPAAWTALEYSHGNPHVFIGGNQRYVLDHIPRTIPIFLESSLVHRAELSRGARETQYPPNNAACSSAAHFGTNTMQPFFPMTNIDGLSNQYTAVRIWCMQRSYNLYTYQARPTCSGGNPQGCGSRFLFCDFSHGAARCAAKIAVGGNCGGYFNTTTYNPAPHHDDHASWTKARDLLNEQQCCGPWANNGECRNNPSYMNLWCRASCGICRPTTYNLNVECNNRHPMCATWAARGECTSNPSWMIENCRQACNRCGQTRQQVCYGGGGSTSQRRPDMSTLMSSISDTPSQPTTQAPS